MQTKQELYALGLAALGLMSVGGGIAPPVSAAALPAAPAVARVGETTLTSLDITTVENGTQITLTANQSFTPLIQALPRPKATMITVAGSWNDGRSGYTNVRQNGVQNIRTGSSRENGQNLVRVVANSRQSLTWSVQSSPDRRRWTVTIWKPGYRPEGLVSAAVGKSKYFASGTLTGSNTLRTLLNRRLATAAAAASSGPQATAASTVATASEPANLTLPALSLPRSAARPIASSARVRTLTAPKQSGIAAGVSSLPAIAIVSAPLLRAVPFQPRPKPAAGAVSRSVVKRPPVVRNRAVMAANRVSVTAPTFTAASVAPSARRVSLDFVSADISEVVKALALQSGINIILATNGASNAGASGAIQDKITVSLKRVSFAEALDTVVNLSGYRYARIGNTYAVGTPDAVSALARGSSVGIQTSASIPFIFSDGVSLRSSIESSFPTLKGRITVVTIGSEGRLGSILSPTSASSLSANALPGTPGGLSPALPDPSLSASPAGSGGISRVIPKGGVVNVSASPAEIEAVRSFIDATETALIEAPYREQLVQSKRFAGLTTEVYKIKYASAPDLIQVLQQLVSNVYVTPGPTPGFKPNSTGQSLSYTASAIPLPGGVVLPPGTATGGPATTNNVTVTSSTTTLLLTGLPEDLARAQDVLAKIDTRVPQMIYETKVLDINAQDALRLGLTYDFSRPVNVGESNQGGPGGITVGPTQSSGPGRTPNFGAVFRTPYSVLAQLQATLNNNKGKILSNPNLSALDGQTATVFVGDQIKYVTNIQQTQQGQNVTTETATVGITLKVTGRYSPDGTITLYVHPEVSSISSFLNVGNGIQLPQIATRFVDTTIRVKDGETIAIGGLISDSDVRNIQKVPFLGDIPFFGELFKFRQNTRSRSEIVVLLTSRLIKE
ncbi:MAG: hypothetical protein H7Z41_09225 [Cytophagales bacterium]|nr:hypothetical protein [Armatimonadota bacterium]